MAITAKVSGIRRRYVRGKGEVARSVTVTDDAYRGIVAGFDYARGPHGWRLVEVRISQPDEHLPVLAAGAIRDMPTARWQRTAHAHLRAADERRGATQQQLSPQLLRLAEVAGAYRANLAAGLKDPVAAIARDYGVKPGTAGSWVYRARKAGLLGEALSRTAGEDIGRESES